MSGTAPVAGRRPKRVERPAWAVPTRWIIAGALGAALLRVIGLGRFGLWIDEAFTLHDAQALSLDRINRFPLGLALLKGWLALFEAPFSETTLRLPAALLGALTLPLTAWTFRPLIGGRRAWIAAALLGLSSWHLYWSQSARAYTLMLSLSLLGAGLCARGCTQARVGLYWSGVLIAACAALAHPTGALVALALVLAPALSRSRTEPLAWSPKVWVGATFSLFAVLVASPWLAALWQDYAWRKSGASVAHFALTTGFYVGVPLALALACAAWDTLRSGSAATRMVLIVLVLGASATLSAAVFVRASAQYVFVLAPWMAALAACALDDAGAARTRARVLGALVLLWAAVDLVAYLTVRHGDRPRWRDAYSWVARARGDEDLVVGMAAPVGGFYLDPRGSALRSPSALVPLTPFAWDELRYWCANERSMWLVLNREDLSDWPSLERERIERFLREQCELRRTFAVDGTPRRLDVEVHFRP